MKILSCVVENFGKISDLELDFSEGMNVIHEPNAWGKSTLAAFIKAMFYGFESKKEPGAIDKERNIYMPWQGGVYGGELTFAVGSKKYRIVRHFGKTEKTDEFHIYDLQTNLLSVDYTDKVGEELFELDGPSFKRSIFIAQNECEVKTSDSINAKLGNLAENTNDINNYEQAQLQLKNMANQLSPNRVTGSLKKRRNHLTELEMELRSYQAAEEAMTRLAAKQKETIAQKDEIVRARNDFAAELENASLSSRKNEQKKYYLSLVEEAKARKDELAPFAEIFPNGVPDDKMFGELQQKARRLDEIRANQRNAQFQSVQQGDFEQYAMMFENGVPSDEEIEELLQEQNSLNELREQHAIIQTQLAEREKEWLAIGEQPEDHIPGFPPLSLFGVIITAVGIILSIIMGVQRNMKSQSLAVMLGIGIILVAVGVILFFVGLRRRGLDNNILAQEAKAWLEQQLERKKVIEDLQQKDTVYNRRIARAAENTKEFFEKYKVENVEEVGNTKTLYAMKDQVREYHRMMGVSTAYQQYEQEYQKNFEELRQLGDVIGHSFGEDPMAEITMLQTEATKYHIAEDAVKLAIKKLETFAADNDVEALMVEDDKNISLDEINAKIRLLDSGLEDVRKTIEQYNRQMEDLQEQLDMRDEKYQEFEECKALQEAEQNKYEVVVITQEFLQKARESFTAKYMTPIITAFHKYYDMILQEDKKNWIIDSNITFKKKELGEFRDTNTLSAGYQDLIGVCMRLALADAMFQEEKPFLLLDDPFVNLDEEKLSNGKQLLSQVASEYQVIYFTCHNSRSPEEEA